MPYGIKIELDGVDITQKGMRFEITARLDSYVRELSLDIADPDLYDTLDFSIFPEAPQIEIFTRTGVDWVSQGKFFIERPTYQVSLQSTLTGIWGRSLTALLGPPFAVKMSKTWDADTTFFAVCAEMCAAAGLTWDSSYSDIDDFWIPAQSYRAENLYPIEIISEILQVAYGEDAFVSTDRDNHVCIGLLDRSPSAADHTVQDAVIVRISEQPEWPDFGNRIKISASGSLAGYGVQLSIADKCLSADGESRSKLFARVTDQDGNPVNDLPIAWSTKFGLVTFDQAVSVTAQISIYSEDQRAKSFNEIDLEYPPESILGIYAYKDTAKLENLATGGYTISGNTVRLTDALDYCDQLVRVDYTVSGVAVNYATASVSSGTETVIASLSGNQDSQEIYLDNPCACPPTLRLIANPSSIMVNESARLLAYAESGGLPVADGRTIYMTVDSNPAHGHLPATELRAQRVEVTNETTSAINEISGITQCELDMYAVSVQGVYRAQQDIAGNWSKTGGSIYGSHVGKVVTLNTRLTTGANLIADYTTRGGVANDYIGLQSGTDRIRAIMATSREEPLEATAQISIRAGLDSDGVAGCCDSGLELEPDDPGYGGGGGSGKNKWNHTPAVGCGDLDCRQGETCCTNPAGEDFECRPLSECDGGALRECYPIDCQQNPTSDCMESRFGQALQDGGEECNCTKLCEEEFNHFGTTQNYDGSSYEGINTKVLNEGYAAGSPAFWERYEELKAAAMEACRDQCGDCASADPLTISGAETLTKPGGSQYGASGGVQPYSWSVSGTGASIDENGYVTLTEAACGSITVTVTDKCGASASLSARITNAGSWVLIAYEDSGCCSRYDADCNCYASASIFYHLVAVGACGYVCPNPVSNPCPGECDPSRDIAAMWTYEWQC